MDYYKQINPGKISRKEFLNIFLWKKIFFFAFDENIFPLPKEEMHQHKEWKKEKNRKSDKIFYTPEKAPSDMPNSKCKESAEERRNQEGQG